MGINAGTHRGSCSHRWHSASFGGGESRSALMCLRFIPCYKSGGGGFLFKAQSSRTNCVRPKLKLGTLMPHHLLITPKKVNLKVILNTRTVVYS